MKWLFKISIIVLIFTSCKENKTENKLVGTWVLDSILSPGEFFYKSNTDTKTLIFKKDKTYSYESWNGDVGNKSNGSYFIVENPNRKMKTIAFVADLQIDGDTIRQYMNYDIISLSKTRLKVIEESKFLGNNRSKFRFFNRELIYRLWVH